MTAALILREPSEPALQSHLQSLAASMVGEKGLADKQSTETSFLEIIYYHLSLTVRLQSIDTYILDRQGYPKHQDDLSGPTLSLCIGSGGRKLREKASNHIDQHCVIRLGSAA